MFVLPEKREKDNWGEGHFGASRGARKHKGQDFYQPPGRIVYCSIPGKVTKIGYPYADDLSFRYVQITDSDGNRQRYFYVEPFVGNCRSVVLGQRLAKGDQIGVVQDLTGRYNTPERGPIPNHFHFEVISPDGEYIDPINYLIEYDFS